MLFLCCLIGTCDLVFTDYNNYPAVSLTVIVGPPPHLHAGDRPGQHTSAGLLLQKSMLFRSEAPKRESMLKTCDWISLSDLVLEGSSLPKWLPLRCSNDHYVSDPGLEWEQSLMEVKVSPFHVPKVGELFLLFLSPPPLFLFLSLSTLPACLSPPF